MNAISFMFCALVFSPLVHCKLLTQTEDVEIGARTIFDDDLREIVEFLRLQMPCGYAPADIPPLAPLYASYKDLIWLTDNVNILSNVTNLSITGLNEFDVRQLHFNNIFRKVKFEFNFPEVLILGDYKADIITKIRNATVNIYGNGELNLALRNLRFNGSFVLGPKLSGSVELSKFKVSTALGDVQSKLTGLMNSRLKAKLLNLWIEEFINLTFNDSPDEVNAVLQRWIVPGANKVLDKVPVIAVLALIFGIIDGSLPQECLC